MNSYSLQISLLALMSLIAHPTSASAAQMGPTSRDSVSISVTVPPHIIVAPAVAKLDGSSGAPKLCVGTNGFSQYHLVVVRHSGATEQEEALRAGESSEVSACPGAVAVAPRMIADSELSSRGALTLLIVPD